MSTREVRKTRSPAKHPRQTEAYFRSLTENSSDIITLLEADGTIRYQSASIAKILGYAPEELLGHAVFELVHLDDRKLVNAAFAELLKRPGIAPVEFRFRRKNGSWCQLEAVGRNLLKDSAVRGIVINSRDITERNRVQEALRESEERYALAMAGANDGLWDWNLKTNTVYYSPSWKSLLGHGEKEIGPSPDEWLNRVHPEDVARLHASVAAHVSGTMPQYECEYRIRHKDGSYLWMCSRGIAVRGTDGAIYRLVGSQSDISSRKQAEERLLHDALHDSLTMLPNRALFVDRVSSCFSRLQRHKEFLFAVLFLDLDRFKFVNDGLGHVVGDKLLIEIGRLLQSCVRPEDTVARLGGDEFTLLLSDIDDLNSATRVAHRIQNALTVPFKIDGQEVYTTASIGIALSTIAYNKPEELIRDADTAMYRAKASGKARHQVFDTSMHERAVAMLQTENDLRRAVEHSEFLVYYQAIRSIPAQAIVGFEALVRWQHPVRGIVPPAEFIPIAEETGLIVPIGWWVLHESCRQMRAWQQELSLPEPLSISVNLSSTQFSQPDLLSQIVGILRETGLEPSSLKLEITETVVIENPVFAHETIRQLRALGIKVCIDDFGTGYSSLSYLLRYPIDTLKIDRSFISGLGSGIGNAAIVQTIVSLAHNLGMDVVAEGVETEQQLAHLAGIQCEQAQGYLFSKPVTADKAFDLVKRAHSRTINA